MKLKAEKPTKKDQSTVIRTPQSPARRKVTANQIITQTNLVPEPNKKHTLGHSAIEKDPRVIGPRADPRVIGPRANPRVIEVCARPSATVNDPHVSGPRAKEKDPRVLDYSIGPRASDVDPCVLGPRATGPEAKDDITNHIGPRANNLGYEAI